MDNKEAEEHIRYIREVVEQSARFTYYSGLSVVIAGLIALAAFGLSLWVAREVPRSQHSLWFTPIWVAFAVLAVSLHLALLQRKARRAGDTIWGSSICTVLKAGGPGLFIATVLTVYLLDIGKMDPIPSIWALGWGACCWGVGMFNVKAIRVFGLIQMATGALGLFLARGYDSLCVFGLSLGVYHVIYGLWLGRKYGW